MRRWLRLLATPCMSDVHTILSSTAGLSSCRFAPVASWMESAHLLFGLPVFLLPSMVPSIAVFPTEPAFAWRAPSRTASVLSLLPPSMFQANCSRIHLFVCLAVQVCVELSFNSVCQMTPFDSYQLSSLSSFCIHTWIIRNTRFPI